MKRIIAAAIALLSLATPVYASVYPSDGIMLLGVSNPVISFNAGSLPAYPMTSFPLTCAALPTPATFSGQTWHVSPSGSDTATQATGTITLSTQPSVGQWIKIGVTEWDFIANGATPVGTQIALGTNVAGTLTAITAALNAATDAPTQQIHASATSTVLTLGAMHWGPAGNGITFSTNASASVSGASTAGGTGGDGTAAHPWATIQGVFSASVTGAGGGPRLTTVPWYHRAYGVSTNGYAYAGNEYGVVRPGDRVLVAGDATTPYGPLTIGAYQQQITNSDWVTIAPEPGATPVIAGMVEIGTVTRIAVEYLTAQETGSTGYGIVTVKSYGGTDITSDIFILGMTLQSEPDSAWWATGGPGYSIPQWAANQSNGIVTYSNATCISAFNNTIKNVRVGAGIGSQYVTFKNNIIDGFGSDAFDYSNSHLDAEYNQIVNSNYLNDGNHPDGMQNQSLVATVDVVLKYNLVHRDNGTGRVSFPSILQGLFDGNGDITGCTFQNNTVITSSGNGVAASSVHNCLIDSNTVVDDQSNYGTTSNLQRISAPDIGLSATSHNGTASSNVTVSNNTAPEFAIQTTGTGITIANNSCPNGVNGWRCVIGITSSSGYAYSTALGYHAAGSDSGAAGYATAINVVDSMPYSWNGISTFPATAHEMAFSRSGSVTMVDSSGYITYGSNQLLTGSVGLATQSVATDGLGSMILNCTSSVSGGYSSITLSGSATGSLTCGYGIPNELLFTPAVGTLTLTVANVSGHSAAVVLSGLAHVMRETSLWQRNDPQTGSAWWGPRFDYTGAGIENGILNEAAATNKVTYSNAFTNSAWTPTNATVTTDAITSPAGMADAESLTSVLTSGASAITQASPYVSTAGGNATLSVYAHASGGQYVTLNVNPSPGKWASAVFDLNSGVSQAATQTAVGASGGTIISARQTLFRDGWYRLTLVASIAGQTVYGHSIALAATATGNSFITSSGLPTASWTGAESVDLWGAQFEDGTLATSYIPTLATPVTRAADSLGLDMAGAGAALVAAGPSVVDYIPEGTTTVLRRAILPSGTLFFNGEWDRKLCVYPAGTSLTSHMTPDGPC